MYSPGIFRSLDANNATETYKIELLNSFEQSYLVKIVVKLMLQVVSYST